MEIGGNAVLKILVVGQQSEQRASLASLLRAEGFGVTEVADSRSAHQALMNAFEATGDAGFNLIIAESQAPAQDAALLLQEVRSMGLRRMPFLVISPTISYEDVEMIALQKPASILIKPYVRETLLARMNQLLGTLAAAA